MINPSPQSYFRYRLNEKREEGVYASRQRAPLGLAYVFFMFIYKELLLFLSGYYYVCAVAVSLSISFYSFFNVFFL